MRRSATQSAIVRSASAFAGESISATISRPLDSKYIVLIGLAFEREFDLTLLVLQGVHEGELRLWIMNLQAVESVASIACSIVFNARGGYA